jgi:hypothetical protein
LGGCSRGRLRSVVDVTFDSARHGPFRVDGEQFRRQTRSTTSVASKTGQRYLSGASHVLLFVREEAKDELGTRPYLFLGPATYVSHTGDRPIAITWQLKHAMPTDFFANATVAAG